MVSNTRLYGAAIAFASGGYSLASAAGASRMVASAWLMLGLGAVVIVHGVLLLTSFADDLGATSGALMVGYSLVMLANQVTLATGAMADGSGGMDDGMGMDGSGGMGGGMGGDATMTATMSWDLGMVVLAVLMLVSGLIMLRDGGSAMNGM